MKNTAIIIKDNVSFTFDKGVDTLLNALFLGGYTLEALARTGIGAIDIIDSETLMPADNFKSVSVICADSGIADALSTTLFCMSHEEGLELLENCLDTEVMWVLPSGEKLYTDGFKKYCE